MRNNSSRRAAVPAPKRTTIRTAAVGVAALACLTAAACSSSGSSSSKSSSSANPLAPSATGSVVVGSANFPENEVLAQIYVDALQGKGIKVTPKFNIGAREVYYPEVVKGAITIIPDYNGALLTTFGEPEEHRHQHRSRERGTEGQAAELGGDPQLRARAGQGLDHGHPGDRHQVPPHVDLRPDPVREGLRHRRPAGVQDAGRRDPRPEECLRADLQVLPAAGRVRADHDHRAAERQGPGRGPVHHHAADHHRPLRLAGRPEEHCSPRRT